MANETAIGWTDLSWNPVHGCSKVSPGCAHCYAETLSLQRGFTSAPWSPANASANVILKPKKLGEPFSGAKVWRGLGEAAARAGKTDGKLVFVNSMSDLFHEEVPDEFIGRVFATMARAPKHTFQILTKRPERMHDVIRADGWEFSQGFADGYADRGTVTPPWPLPNVWLGVSIENRRFVHRADLLRDTPAAVRFISAEPLLGPLIGPETFTVETGQGPQTRRGWPGGVEGAYRPSLDLTDIDWLIAGGESGPGHRPMREEWVRDLRETCLAPRCTLCGGIEKSCWSCTGGRKVDATAFFFKQWGGARPTSGGRELDGRTWDEFPQAREGVPV